MGSNRDKPFDVIDMIINLLREHEKRLDELIYRIEVALSAGVPEPIPRRELKPPHIGISAVLKNWEDFKRMCSDASLLGFVIGERTLKISAIVGGVLYVYEEVVPSFEVRYREEEGRVEIVGVEAETVGLVTKALRGRLDCGLEFGLRDVEIEQIEGVSLRRITWDIEPRDVRSWLATEMRVDPSSIVEGVLQLRSFD